MYNVRSGEWIVENLADENENHCDDTSIELCEKV